MAVEIKVSDPNIGVALKAFDKDEKATDVPSPRTWASTDESVATVTPREDDSTADIKAVGPGSCQVTASAGDLVAPPLDVVVVVPPPGPAVRVEIQVIP